MSYRDFDQIKMAEVINTANTGLDAIKRAPIVQEDTGIKCLRIQDISQKKEFSNWGFCEVNSKNYESFKLLKDDIIVARTGETVGVNQMISENLKSVFNNGLIRIRVNEKRIRSKFLYYNLQSLSFRNHIDSVARGSSTQPNLRIEALLDFKMILPNLEIQDQIASVLSSLDDKIELNRQINQTLEAIAQALFKEWFVDFNFPGATGEMAESELGEIPKGWRVNNVGELVDTVSITHKFLKGKAIFLNTSDIEEGKILHRNYSDKEGLPGQAKKSIKELDILFTEIRPANKRYALIDFDAEDFVVSTKLMVLRSISNVHPIVVYNFLTSFETLKQLQHLAESRSGTFPQITFSQVKDMKLVLPEGEILNKYETLAWSFFNQLKSNEEQIKTLVELRDTLLPKLMKGEIKLTA